MPDFVRVTDVSGEYTTTRQWAEIAKLTVTDKDAVDVFGKPLPAKPKKKLPPAGPPVSPDAANQTPAVATTKKESR